MLDYEIYKLTYHDVTRQPHVPELGKTLLENECKCGHAAYFHNYDMLNIPDQLARQFVFKDCKMLCSCYAFRRDNLTYLEYEADRRDTE